MYHAIVSLIQSFPVLPFYGFLITVGGEAELFWRKKVTGASVLFFASRYLTVVAFVRNFVEVYVLAM